MGLNEHISHAEVENLKFVLTNQAPSDEVRAVMEELREHAKVFGTAILHECVKSPERDEAIMYLRKATMFAVAALALHNADE